MPLTNFYSDLFLTMHESIKISFKYVLQALGNSDYFLKILLDFTCELSETNTSYHTDES